MVHILLIEDNKVIAENEQVFLENAGWTVDIVHDGETWLHHAMHYVYDMFIIDWMLPTMQWIDIVKHIREKKKTPIIMTTAKWQIQDKWEAYTLWIDDYLVKPYELDELVMRVKALLQRSEIAPTLRVWDIVVLLDEQRIVYQWEKIKLPLKEYLLFEYLAQRAWQAISRTDLIEYVWWWDAWEHDELLDVYIANLRKKFGKESIETIRWFGYRVE